MDLVMEKSEGVNYLHPTQIKLAYEEGQAATQRKVQAREEKIRSGGTTDSTTKKKGSVSLRGAKVGSKTYAPVNRKTVDSRQWASVKAMRAFSRAVGVDVVFYQSQTNERGRIRGRQRLLQGRQAVPGHQRRAGHRGHDRDGHPGRPPPTSGPTHPGQQRPV